MRYATLWAHVSGWAIAPLSVSLDLPNRPPGELMTALDAQHAADVADGPAIAELHRLHAVQRAAFLADPYPDAAERQAIWRPWPAW